MKSDAGHFRDIRIEIHVDEGAAGIGIGVCGRDGSRAPGSADANALVPLLFLDRPSVDLHVNVVVSEKDIGDSNSISALGGWSGQRNHLLQLGSAWTNYPILELQAVSSHRKRGANIDKFGVQQTDEFDASLLGHLGRAGCGRRLISCRRGGHE